MSEIEVPAGWIAHVRLMLDSYERWLGRPLIERHGAAQEQAHAIFAAPFVVVSHGTQADPLLNYANRTALQLWEIDIPTLLQTPSRLTAEPVHRDERAQLLARTTANGFVDDYQGIRVSTTGRRFRIEQAIVWNLTDSTGAYLGQAATFSHWTELPAKEI